MNKAMLHSLITTAFIIIVVLTVSSSVSAGILSIDHSPDLEVSGDFLLLIGFIGMTISLLCLRRSYRLQSKSKTMTRRLHL